MFIIKEGGFIQKVVGKGQNTIQAKTLKNKVHGLPDKNTVDLTQLKLWQVLQSMHRVSCRNKMLKESLIPTQPALEPTFE